MFYNIALEVDFKYISSCNSQCSVENPQEVGWGRTRLLLNLQIVYVGDLYRTTGSCSGFFYQARLRIRSNSTEGTVLILWKEIMATLKYRLSNPVLPNSQRSNKMVFSGPQSDSRGS